MSVQYFALPRLTLRFFPIWRRQWLVWRKVAVPAILGHLADPVIYMLGLGYGLGSLLPEMGGTSYIAFLAAGTLCYSSMNSASFESLYGAFARMHEQRTWEAIMNTPVTLDDVVLSEILWSATKSLMSGIAVLIVIWILGLTNSLMSLWMIPLVLLIGLAFSAVGLIMTALAPAYDFFMYYFTLVITPMMLLCGVFFPVSQLPEVLQALAAALPLTHAVDLARPLMNGAVPAQAMLHIGVLLTYALVGFYISLVLFRRRLSR
ncbi:MAG: ABC transporter permease [Gammaproteobacteria bacterium]|nr:ABC transporter permease [Gammaproteobacteria bacterium]MBU1624126.1 ABC transporter permease [Gammaproteobacteria bacterium]MBU1981854.1 ABC transporter permease [Gammaproteobacteria bacterium]